MLKEIGTNESITQTIIALEKQINEEGKWLEQESANKEKQEELENKRILAKKGTF
ncbi:hypothetical protein WMO40_02615 [Bacillaceae bacterium CLA-AA-H227]|uniref:Uncharacterized protein n=1 Tax=Robertmurraya yapensis (ex Hitch et al 2024) TaxID=3133160 RepID=A0ACC6S6H6_9BACI